jgi:transketolase
MMLNRGFVSASFIVFSSICIALLVIFHGSPIFAGDMDNTEKQTETEKELIEQYERQQGLYEKLQKEFDNHPVTKWKQEVDRNKKAIAILDKQLRDMVRFENEEQIEELRRNNEELQKKIETKKDEREILKKKVDDAKERLESLKKQLGLRHDREDN